MKEKRRGTGGWADGLWSAHRLGGGHRRQPGPEESQWPPGGHQWRGHRWERGGRKTAEQYRIEYNISD